MEGRVLDDRYDARRSTVYSFSVLHVVGNQFPAQRKRPTVRSARGMYKFR